MRGDPVRPWRAALAALLLGLLTCAHAVEPGEVLPDRQLEARARALSAELRCLVCQNQSIDDSDAPLARDLRLLVRERLKEGDSDAAVRSFLVARYGEFVLLKPAFGPHTWALWLAPLGLIGASVFGLIRALRRRPAALAVPLTEEERAALDRVLGREEGRGRTG